MSQANLSRRAFLKSATAGLAMWSAYSMAGGAFVQAVSTDANKPPNVLFLSIDDLKPILGCYGHPEIHAPNIDKLAEAGTVFNNAYAQVPLCGPSRASLLSSLRPRADRFVTNEDAHVHPIPGAITLPEVFRENGYHSVSIGKIFHHTNDTAERSWSEPPIDETNAPNGHLMLRDPDSENYILASNGRGPFFEAPDVEDNAYLDGRTCDYAIEKLQELKEQDSPFFLAVGFVRPHLPFYAPKQYWDLYDQEEIELAENRYRPVDAPDSLRPSGEMHSYHKRDIEYNSDEFHRIARHGYYACVSYVDNLVGKILGTLDELGLRENTIIVLWGDHGWLLGEHDFWSKHYLLHEALHSPLIISAPGITNGAKAEGLVEFIDIYPTLCALAGITPPESIDGQSLMPLLADSQAAGKPAVFSRFLNGDTVLTKDHIYTEYTVNDRTDRMLFDLVKDPQENHNVAADPAYEDVVAEMSRLLRNIPQ